MAIKARRRTKPDNAATPPRAARLAATALLAEAFSTSDAASTAVEVDTVSGLYSGQLPNRDELRLDVDGVYPQMTASGVVINGLTDRLHWVARIGPAGATDEWNGEIWFKDGVAALLPHTLVHIAVRRSPGLREATVRFSGGGVPVERVYRRSSTNFHQVEFEFDVVEGAGAVAAIDTCAHPNRPADLPCESLSIETVFKRAGFDVSVSAGSGSLPLTLAGTNRLWSNVEMHDAMQTFWSRFASSAQWSLWVLYAAQHEDGHNLGGIMFDSIGPNHRQGTAIFSDSFVADAPAGDAAPAAWVERMRFWTTCHEMGHAFNLAHSWQKALGVSWIPISNEPEVRGFMNYPFRVLGGQTAFFSDFAYRFSDQELLFMRHAPERLVEMGNAVWFDHHAFSQAETSPEPKFRLELRVNRPTPDFEFLEPCMLEMKLTNISDEPQLVSERVLQDADRMTVVIKKQGQPARQWQPYARYCHKSRRIVLEPAASRYEALFVGAGGNGWDLADPGIYTVQIVLRIADEDFVSNALQLRIRPPRSYDEENLAQDFFMEDVGRVLAFEGSRVLGRANDVLRDAADRLPDRAVANHALVALGRPLMRDGKLLALPPRAQVGMESAAAAGGEFAVVKARPDDGKQELAAALMKEPEKAAQTLGNIDYKAYADEFSDALADEGDTKAAASVQNELHATLQSRKVAPRVLAEIKKKRASFAVA